MTTDVALIALSALWALATSLGFAVLKGVRTDIASLWARMDTVARDGNAKFDQFARDVHDLLQQHDRDIVFLKGNTANVVQRVGELERRRFDRRAEDRGD
jgi:hypothetical protein